MSFNVGDRVMVEHPSTGSYDPPWCVGKVTEVGDYYHWDGFVKVQANEKGPGTFNGGKPYWYPRGAVRHID
ncbi:hypothetical protein GIKK_58 [Gordonia phage GiKK]|nr:hypothetical protein GIKK_58 [Gordonia phage GiKK]